MDKVSDFTESMKLTGCENHLNWSIRLKTILRIKNCWDDIVHQPILIHNLDGPAQQDIRMRRFKAIPIIQATVHNDLLPSICKFEDTPAELWVHLRHRYESRNTQRRLVLSHELSSVKLVDGGSLDKYLRHIDSVAAQLSNIGHRAPQSDLIHHTLKGLPASYGPFVHNFLGDMERQPAPTYINLVERLQSTQFFTEGKTAVDEELHYTAANRQPFKARQSFQQTCSNRPSLTTSQSEGGNSRSATRCEYCSRSNHVLADCHLRKLDDSIAQLQIRASNLCRSNREAVNLVEDSNPDQQLDEPEPLKDFSDVEANFTGDETPIVDFYLDSGASNHVTGDRSILTSFQAGTSTSGVSTANGTRLAVAGRGKSLP
jgi:hypothetical protein